MTASTQVPAPVERLEHNGGRHDRLVLAELASQAAPSSNGSAPAGARVERTDLPAAKLEALLMASDAFRSTWERRRLDHPDWSQSEYDLALAAFTVHAGWSDGEIGALIVAHRGRYGEDMAKAARTDYIERTLLRAHQDAGDAPAPGTVAYRSRLTPSDLGNAERVIDRHGHDLMIAGGRWHAWDGARFAPDDTGEIVRRAKDTARSIRDEARLIQDDDKAKKRFSWAIASESSARIDSAIKLAATEAKVVVRADDLDADLMALNVANGTLDLQAGELREHSRADRITKLAPVEFDPSAACPHWDESLELWLPDPEVRGFVQRWFGYCLTGDTSEQCMFICVGSGANGKSTLLEVFRAAMGDYAANVDASTFTTSHRRSVRSDLARLRGNRLVTASEIEQDARMAEVLIKQATGGEPITAAELYRNEIEYTPHYKIVVAANHLPEVRDTSHAMWRRLRVVTFPTKIEHPDKRLPAALKRELPGILNWALAGCAEWMRNGLGYPPDAVSRATHAYRADQDQVGQWVEDRCLLGTDRRATSADLKASYLEWAEATETVALPWNRVITDLESRFGVIRDRDEKARYLLGIGVSG